MLQGIFLVWLPMFLIAAPRLSGSKSIGQRQIPTTKPFLFDIVVQQAKTTKKPRTFKNLLNRHCCRVGKRAARKGYSCYIKINIAQIRINMPMRYKMKTEVHGNKYDYEFAKKMEFCSKTRKLTNKFNHCCDKVARNMDRRRSRG